MLPRRLALSVLLLVTPTLFAAEGKGKGCRKAVDDIDDLDDDFDPVAQLIDVELSVVRIDPPSGDENASFRAMIFGSGFKPGATVRFGDISAAGVEYVDENNLSVRVPGLASGTWDVGVTNPDGGFSTLRRGLNIRGGASTADCRMIRVQFDLDSSAIAREGQSDLDAALACFQGSSGAIRIAGHCDERGTTDYNLALGQRRGDAVQRYLVSKGVAPSRISVVSFGEERPLDPGHDEGAWTRNRRAEISLVE